VYPVTLGLIIGNRSLFDPVRDCLRDLPAHVVFEQPSVGDWPALLQKLDQTKPDLIVIDVSALKEPMAEAFGKILAIPQPPIIAAVDDQAAPERILEAVRAGAADFLYPPIDLSLRRALTRISDEREQQRGSGRRGGTVLAFLSSKGGCGATTIACHLALELPLKGWLRRHDHRLPSRPGTASANE
jgi:CheY-like chemotaxis protein